MAAFEKTTPPAGSAIANLNAGFVTPDDPIIPFIRGDGVGPEIWAQTRIVLDAAIDRAYGGRRRIAWFEIHAGDAAREIYGAGQVLPEDTFAAIRAFKVAIKGPLATPVGGGIRSCNVALRQCLDLYANVRPVRFIPGLPSPLKDPGKVDLVIFRENTEDVYAGVEWPAESDAAREIVELIATKWMPGRAPLPADSAIGIKPMTRRASQRLVRRAIQYALDQGRKSVTLVHKGNIMKFTEGAFRNWGYELAREEFGDRILDTKAFEALHGIVPPGKVLLKDRIADAMFQDLILHPDQHDVVATTNLNGDYLSDAAAALIGGLGFAAGANIGDEYAVFEAVHGTAPDIACQDVANPSSLILTGVEMLRFLGWHEAADAVYGAVCAVIGGGWVTADVACWLPNVVPLSCSEFGQALCERIAAGD